MSARDGANPSSDVKAKKKKKKKTSLQSTSSQRSAIITSNPAIIPLCELFAAIDDVFTTEGAFAPQHIHKSLGRAYRAWKECRISLDPDFDPKRYPKRPRRAEAPSTSITGQKTTFVTSRKNSESKEKPRPRKGAKSAS